MDISLPPELKKFVAQEVEGGHYQTASEVIRAGLRRLKEDKAKSRLPELPATRAELENQLLASIERLDRGEGINGPESLSRLLVKIDQSGGYA